MAKRKESKEISRKIRQQEKEKKRQIDLANRMLVPAPKKTAKSIGLLSFDPAGAFRFEGGRWVKVYEVTGNLSEIAEVTTKLQSRVRIIHMIVPEKDGDAYVKTYVSLIGYGDIYEDIRLAFEEDERIMQDTVGLRSLIVDEAISVITKLNGINKEPFSFASFVRSTVIVWLKFWQFDLIRITSIGLGLYDAIIHFSRLNRPYNHCVNPPELSASNLLTLSII